MAMATRMRPPFPRNFFDIVLRNVKSCSKIVFCYVYRVLSLQGGAKKD